jgi:hypothetical protein
LHDGDEARIAAATKQGDPPWGTVVELGERDLEISCHRSDLSPL